MSALLSPRLCVYFALPEEAAALLPRMQFAKIVPTLRDLQGGHVSGHLNGLPLSVTCSGVGMQNASRHLRYLGSLAQAEHVHIRLTRESYREQIPIRRLLFCGFAGGLQDDLPIGSLILASNVLSLASKNGEEAYTPDFPLLSLAESVSVSGVRKTAGTLATAARVLTTAREKRALAEKTGAVGVDMETAGAAQAAEAQGIPWIALRAITDGVNENLPLDFNALTDGQGNVDRGRVVRAALLRPWKIPGLMRLNARSTLAAKNLADFIEAYLAALPEEDT